MLGDPHTDRFDPDEYADRMEGHVQVLEARIEALEEALGKLLGASPLECRCAACRHARTLLSTTEPDR